MPNPVFQKDLYRFFGDKGERLKNRLLRTDEIKYLYVFRKCQMEFPALVKVYYKLRLHYLQAKTHIQIPSNTQIGEGFYIGHVGPIIVNPNAKLGKNINIAVGVTIGQENRGARKGAPTISDHCWIGTNAVVVGKITIGTDVLIAPNSYVNCDVPEHSIVIGNPAKIVHKENATEGYIDNIV